MPKDKIKYVQIFPVNVAIPYTFATLLQIPKPVASVCHIQYIETENESVNI
jgi:hypothetical protein